jgi:hypothetical protein
MNFGSIVRKNMCWLSTSSLNRQFATAILGKPSGRKAKTSDSHYLLPVGIDAASIYSTTANHNIKEKH